MLGVEYWVCFIVWERFVSSDFFDFQFLQFVGVSCGSEKGWVSWEGEGRSRFLVESVQVEY